MTFSRIAVTPTAIGAAPRHSAKRHSASRVYLRHSAWRAYLRHCITTILLCKASVLFIVILYVIMLNVVGPLA